MLRKLSLLCLVLITFVALSSYAFAWPRVIEGKPDSYEVGQNMGYFIWLDDDGFHVRTTTMGMQREYTGTVRSNGDFHAIEFARLEHRDRFKVSQDRDTIAFKFTTKGDSDGFNFKLRGGSFIEFNLRVDGMPIKPQHIYVGRRDWHPERNEFRIGDFNQHDPPRYDPPRHDPPRYDPPRHDNWPQTLQGIPTNYDVGDSRGYFIWKDDNGFHLRTTTRGRRVVFTGSVATNGEIRDVASADREHSDRIRFDNRRDIIAFKFETRGDRDGFDFKVFGGSYIQFNLSSGGEPINPNNINVGRRNWHPSQADFRINR